MAFVDPLVGPSGSGNAWDNRRMFDAVQKQTAPATVRQFDSATARDDAISLPAEGQLCYRTDLDTYQWYNGTAWVTLMQPGAWQLYTPALTATTTNPTLGTGSVAFGHYYQIGKQVTVQFRIVFGTSGVNAGSGLYRVSLPVTPETTTICIYGTFWAYDSSAAASAIGALNITSGGLIQFLYSAAAPSGNSSEITNAAPWTWAASDQLRGTLTYEAA
jgi:hypothetical protein